MGDESGRMNLDLNLGPLASLSSSQEVASLPGFVLSDLVSLEDWVEEQPPFRMRASTALRLRSRQRWRRQSGETQTSNISPELLGIHLGDLNGPQTGEGSVAPEQRTQEAVKTCENNNRELGDKVLQKDEEPEKDCGGEGSFFDCNICLDLASDPVVTCCGHLFCWGCLYRWLNIHSEAKECPVCKGEVTVKNVTPIYGRGSKSRALEENSDPGIPIRPHARRVESLRQSILRNSLNFSAEEMFQSFGRYNELTRDMVLPQELDNDPGTFERNHALINQLIAARRIRTRDRNITSSPAEEAVDLTQNSSNSFPSLVLRRSQPYRAAPFPPFVATVSSSERLNNEGYFQSQPIGRNQETHAPVDDRDSFSSIGAVIHSGSQTVDTAIEIDSTVSLSTSSSRRRNDLSRVSDVDSGDSRANRRRRLN